MSLPRLVTALTDQKRKSTKANSPFVTTVTAVFDAFSGYLTGMFRLFQLFQNCVETE
jgi:hypothetical protein